MKSILFATLFIYSSLSQAMAFSDIASDSATSDFAGNNLYDTQHFINGNAADEVSYLSAEQNLTSSTIETYQEGQNSNEYAENADTNQSDPAFTKRNDGEILLNENIDTSAEEFNPQEVKTESISPFEKMPSNKQLKKTYGKSSYSYQKGDKYIPLLVSLPSLLIPGLGQVINGDVLQGIGYLGGTALSFFTVIYGGLINWGGSTLAGNSLMIIGAVGFVLFPVTSAIQSYKLSKYKNLYYRDLKQSNTIEVGFKPWINIRDKNVVLNTQSVGLSLNVRF